MKKYGVKGVVPMLVVALVLGLATSGISQGKWVFGVKGNITWAQPLKAGGDMTQDFNVWVDEWNPLLVDLEELITDADPENEITIDLAEKITRAYSVHVYGERRIGQRFGIRTSVEYLRSNKSKTGWDAYFWSWGDLDWLSELYEYEVSASAWKIAIAPRLIMPVGKNLELNFGAGPFYCSTTTSWTEYFELIGDWWGEMLWYTSNAKLTGSGFGYYGDIELKFKLSDRMAIDVEVGYESTPKMTTSGLVTTTGEEWEVAFDEEIEMEGASDWTGFYVAVSLEFAI